MIDDKRTDTERALTVCYVVATDSFMSGWGLAKGRSLFAVPCKSWEQSRVVLGNMHNRSEMKYVRVQSNLPRLRKGDHLSIRSMDECSRFYTPGGFK